MFIFQFLFDVVELLLFLQLAGWAVEVSVIRQLVDCQVETEEMEPASAGVTLNPV